MLDGRAFTKEVRKILQMLNLRRGHVKKPNSVSSFYFSDQRAFWQAKISRRTFPVCPEIPRSE